MNRFENGFDSFKKAIIGLENRNENEFALKDIIINFHHSVEVLFKHILYSREKCLIYSNIDNWINCCFDKKIGKKSDNCANPYYTITFDETLKRVLVLCEISIDLYTYEGFIKLCKLRNSLIHDEISLNRDEVEQVFVSLITTVTYIVRNYLPENEKRLFCAYVDSDEYNDILKRLFVYNMRWRTVTISYLLNLYMDTKHEDLNQAQITNIVKTLSVLGVYLYEEYDSYNINAEYYNSYISYLKQEICNLLLRCSKEDLNSNELPNLIKSNKVIPKILEEYLENAALYAYKLLGNIENTFFEDIQTLNTFLNQNELVNNHNTYVILYCIYRIAEVCVLVTQEKRREDLLKRIYLDDKKVLSIYTMYKSLCDWYSANGWYNNINMDKLEDYEKIVFGKETKDSLAYDKLCRNVNSGILEKELYQNIIGEMGKWGTIDYVDEVSVEDLVTVIKSNNIYTLIFYVSFGTQTYADHEYYDNGSTTCFVKVKGSIIDNQFLIEEMDNLGYTIGFSNFRFM